MAFDLDSVLSIDLLDDDLKEGCEGVTMVFQEGYCHVLALALHDATGWPIWSLKIAQGRERGQDEHFLVADPAGNLLDVQGTNTPDDVITYWNGLYNIPSEVGFFELEEVDSDYIWGLINSVYAEEPEPAEALAREAARILLEVEYGLSVAA
jgi:hypothetical protein